MTQPQTYVLTHKRASPILRPVTVYIRPSLLPGWGDCARRSAARSFRKLIEGAGFKLRHSGQTVGAAVGTAVHEGAHYTMLHKMDHGDIGNDSEAEDRAVESFKATGAEAPITFDATTPQVPTAHKQIARMLKSYRRSLAPTIDPVIVEKRLETTWQPGVIISGQVDTMTAEPGRIRDLKTGVMQRANQAQYGAYGIIHDAHGFDVSEIMEDFVPRVRISSEQPDPTTTVYDYAAAVAAAEGIIDNVVASLTAFQARLQVGHPQPEWAFMANPMSMLCSAKWCPAHSTPFCREHRK